MSAAATRWWWVRHAPVIGYDGIIYGCSEVPCDVSDTAAFRSLAARLPADAVWLTSHLSRTLETAAALAAVLDGAGGAASDPRVEPDLAEQDFGVWHGRSYADLRREGEAGNHKFWLAPARFTPPGGESFTEVIERVRGVIDRLTAEHPGRDIVAVAHGGSIRAALAVALGLEPDSALAFQFENLSLTRIDHVTGPGPGGNWRIVGVNQPAQ